MRVGVDVGGTNTDAVLLGGDEVLGKVKTPSTPDVTSGIVSALRKLLSETAVDPREVGSVMIGTTHFTNAVVERRGLGPVAAVRLALPATEILPPTVDWPEDLLETVDCRPYLLHGGQEFDGRPISDPREDELEGLVSDLHGSPRAVALTSVFSPIDPALERWVGSYLLSKVPGLDITYSHEIGRVGLLERENAAILNAALRSLARETVEGFRRAVREMELDAAVYVTQNDGTLMTADFAERYPVLTFSSGPTNSMRGAGYLSGIEEALVVDVGGTTTDVGALARGFPREASIAVEIGGVRTNFRMPDLASVGLGGGSIVRLADGEVTVGPDSVGYRLATRARVFGGDVLTATDIAVARGVVIGDSSLVVDLDPALVEGAAAAIHAILEEAVDRVRLSGASLPVIVVGGGRILIERPITGASEMVVPEHYEVANAIGAAIAQVSGEIDRVVMLDGTSREAALEAARRDAEARAVAAGADRTSLRLVDAEDVPLTYLPGNASRVRVKVVGELAASPEQGRAADH